MRLVKQDTPHSCGIACLAMVLGTDMPGARDIIGRTCEEVFNLRNEDGSPHPEPYIGLSAREMVHVLFRFGVPTVDYTDKKYWPEGHWQAVYWDDLAGVKLADVIKHLGGGGTAILGVPSLNIPDGSHWIVMHGGEIFDPSPKKTYRTGDAIDIEQAILIGHLLRIGDAALHLAKAERELELEEAA